MSLRDQRIQVFEDTLTFIDYNKKLSESVEYSINHTNVFYEDDYPVFDTKQNRPMKLSVTHERTFESAIISKIFLDELFSLLINTLNVVYLSAELSKLIIESVSWLYGVKDVPIGNVAALIVHFVYGSK